MERHDQRKRQECIKGGFEMDFTEHHLREITENSERSKSNTHRLDEVEEDIKSLKNENRTLYEMSASIKALTDGVVSIKEDVREIKDEQGEMKSEIQDIKNAPVKTKAGIVDDIGKMVITAVVTGILAFLLGQICPVIFM